MIGEWLPVLLESNPRAVKEEDCGAETHKDFVYAGASLAAAGGGTAQPLRDRCGRGRGAWIELPPCREKGTDPR